MCIRDRVDLNKVYVGHSNDTMDIHYLESLLDKGVWIGLDRYPGGRTMGTPNWEQRTETAMRLIADGYGEKIMLGHDWSVTLSIDSKEGQTSRSKYNPDGYLFITRHVLPRLKDLGASEQDIQNIMVDNPRRFFG